MRHHFLGSLLQLLYCVFQACLVLQRRHLPDQPLEYLLKLRCELKSGVKYRERWFPADRLCAEFAVGAALIKQFEASKVGQLAVDTYLSKRRSLPSPRLSSDGQNYHTTSAANGGQKHKNFQSDSKALKRKSCDLDRRHSLSNCVGSVSSESLKSNGVVSNNSTPLSASKSSGHKPLSFYGDTTHSVSPHHHVAKRLLLSDKVPHKNWPKNASSKDLKLPNLLQCKPTNQKPVVVRCKYEDSDSDADVRYSLATDHSDASSDWENTDLESRLEKKRRKLTLVDGIKKSKNNTVDGKSNAVDVKRPEVAADAEIKFKASVLLAGRHSNCKAGIAR